MQVKKDAGNGNNYSVLRSRIFIDADALVGIADKEDTNHKKAIKLAKLVAKRKISLITSNFALGEAITIVSQNVGHQKAVRMGYDIQKGRIVVVDVVQGQREKAMEKFSEQTTKNARFTDMVNMVLMDELKIDTIFSFDGHYPKNGYKLLV